MSNLVVYREDTGEVLLRASWTGALPAHVDQLMPNAPAGVRMKLVDATMPDSLPAVRMDALTETIIPAKLLQAPPLFPAGNGRVVIATPHGFVCGTTKYNIALVQALESAGMSPEIAFADQPQAEVREHLDDLGVKWSCMSPEEVAAAAVESDLLIFHGSARVAHALSRKPTRPLVVMVVHMASDLPLVRYCSHVLDRVVVVGRWMLQHCPDALWCPPPVLLEELEGERPGKSVVYLGRLAAGKGLMGLLSALELLPGYRLSLVGSGLLQSSLEDFVHESASLEGRVEFIPGDMRATRHLHQGSVFVLPSVSEGASIALVEAIAAGLPVVSTRVGDAEWISEEGNVPIVLIPEPAPHLIAEGIRQAETLVCSGELPPHYACDYFAKSWGGVAALATGAARRAPSPRPEVSVIMPVYRYQDVMDGAIMSVLCQDADLELILIDNGNDDDTFVRMQEWERRDARVRAFRVETNIWLSGARNFGLQQARGRHVAFLDPDDRYLPGYLGERVRLLDSGCNTTLSYAGAMIVRGDHRAPQVSREYDARLHTGANYIPCQSVTAPQWALVAAGMNETSWHYGEDWGLWARLGSAGAAVYDPRLVYELHQHPGQWSCPEPARAHEMCTTNHIVSYHNSVALGHRDRHLRILCVLPNLVANGAQRAALETCTCLRDSGHRVDVLGLTDCGSFNDPEWEARGFAPVFPTGQMQVLKAIRDVGYDCAVLHVWPGAMSMVQAHCQIPAVVVHHSCDVDNIPTLAGLPRVDVVVAGAGKANVRFPPAHPQHCPTVTYLENGIDFARMAGYGQVSKSEAKRELGFGEERVALCLTRADAEKGGDVLGRMAGHIVATGARLVVVGMSAGQPFWESAAKGLRDVGADMRGYLPHDQVMKLMRAADVLLVASRREAFSLAMLEALFLGTAVVCTAAAALPLPNSGLIVVEGESDLLSACLATLQSPPAVEPLPDSLDWKRVSGKYEAMLRLLSLRAKWMQSEDLCRAGADPFEHSVSVVESGPRTRPLARWIRECLQAGGCTLESSAATVLTVSYGGTHVDVARRGTHVGTIWLDPVAYGQRGETRYDVCVRPPVQVDPRPFGVDICSVGGAPQIVNSRHIENLNEPGDLGKTGPLFAITDDWLDLVYCLAAAVPVVSCGSAHGLIVTDFTGVLTTPAELTGAAYCRNRDVYETICRNNIAGPWADLYRPNGRMTEALRAVLARTAQGECQ